MAPVFPRFCRGLNLVLLVVAVAGGAASAGCGRLRAATQPEMPVLDAPPPPPRVASPVQAETLPATSPEQTTEDQPPPPRQPTPARPAPARTDGKPPQVSPTRVEREPEPEAPVHTEETRPSRTLQTAESGATSERGIRDQLSRASAGLKRVDYRSLSANLKEQYDVAKRFIQQSEDALKVGNLVYASTLAGKALEIAEVLPR